MSDTQQHDEPAVQRLLQGMITHAGWILGGLAVISLLLLAGGVSSMSEREVSFNPSGEEFDTEQIVGRTFRPSTAELLFIIEDEDGDALDAETLREWQENSEALRASDELAGALSTYFDDSLGVTVTGFYSIADAVDDELRAGGLEGGLSGANDDQVKQALSRLLAEGRPTAELRNSLSIHAERTEASIGDSAVERWSAPAFLAEVRVDRVAFPVAAEEKSDSATRTDAKQADIDRTRALAIERYARDAQDVLRGDEQFYKAWGVAIDQLLTDDESFVATLPYMIGAFAIIVLLVGLFLRSYWAATIAGAGLALTMLWARMLASLAGFDESIIVDVIVPIATISFGIDFMIHAVGRCREELALKQSHRRAYVVGITTVGGALALAFSTSAVAFGSNASSGIPGVIQFGFGAAIALGCAFVMLGVLAPLFLLRIEEGLAGAPAGSDGPVSHVVAGARMLAPSVATALIIIAMIGAPTIGTMALVAYILVLVALPYWWTRRSSVRAGAESTLVIEPRVAGMSMAHAGIVVAGVVRMRYAALPAIAVVTALSAIGAVNVEGKTEPNDFYPSDSELITSIDKVLEHSASVEGGDVLIYVEGNDLADPRALRSAAAAVDSVGNEGSEVFARKPDGSLAVPDNVLDVVRAAIGVPFTRADIASASGTTLTDDDDDGFPDTADQVEAVFSYATDNGIPADENTFVYTADEVRQLLGRHDDAWATVLRFPIHGIADKAAVDAARDIVESGESDLQRDATAAGLALDTSLAGSSVTTQLRIDAITESMTISIPIAMILCLIVAGSVMRSVRLSLASIVPIALVIAWLLGFMYLFGYDLNVVTATIAAISVGVGIDYATHFTMRFREEWRRSGDRMTAIRSTAEGTGTALLLSAATSIMGFALLALAPMPVLAAYGLLTAVMIALSLLAALIVLPSLLYLVTPGEIGVRQVREPAPVAGGEQ